MAACLGVGQGVGDGCFAIDPGARADDAIAFSRARRQDAVVADEMEARRRDEGGELLDELERLEADVRGAVAPARIR